MRFVKMPKHTDSSVTTKGWSGRNNHHPRRHPLSFVGVDGEGITVNGVHRYVLFGIGSEQIEDSKGLEWKDVFKFLYSHYRPKNAYVGFFLGYDFTQIIRTLPENRAFMLLTSEGRALRKHRLPGKAPHPVEYDGWQFDMLTMKRLRIRPKICDCPLPTCKCKHSPWMYICDVGPFFQSSFLKVIDPNGWQSGTEIVSDDEFRIIKEGKERRSIASLDDDMRRYNILENIILARVMKVMDSALQQIDIHLPASKWFGPGQAAQSWLKNEKVTTREEITSIVPAWFIEVARMSYYGGWFEIFMHGIIPGVTHEYDINSAYPSIIAKLPCLLHGVYSHGEGIPTVAEHDLSLVYAKLLAPGLPKNTSEQHIGTMLHRDAHGRILRPLATEGWYWWDELQAAYRAGLIKRLDNRGKQQILKWVKYEPCDCPAPMRGIEKLYLKRLEVGKKSPLGRAARLVYNSDYGKFAQSVGEPLFGNPIYASRITSGCRTMILNAISSHPKGKNSVAMVATDAVYFLSEHPGLSISTALGEWDHAKRFNLTLFKPGVYWDDETRRQITAGGDPYFKARGIKPSDLANSIARIDSIFRSWRFTKTTRGVPCADWEWPTVKFVAAFAMTTALQALRRNKWETAGEVKANTVILEQNAEPSDKRRDIYRDSYEGREIYRSRPHVGMTLNPETGQLEWIPSHPYQKRFGIEDPWSDESREEMGVTEDGNLMDILAWILKGE